jgi:ABC-2 type transport system permease protein
VTAGQTIALVARREVTQRSREKSFAISTMVSIVIIVLVAVLPKALGLGGKDSFTVGVVDPAGAAVAQVAARGADAFDAEITVKWIAPSDARQALADGDVDAVVQGDRIRSQEKPENSLVNALQVANRQVRAQEALQRARLSPQQQQAALAPPPLRVSTVEPVDPERDKRGGLAFFAAMLLYGQLIGYGFYVAMGVVEEKSSRVVEVLLSAIRARHLLAGKVIGLGLLGLGQLLTVVVLGLLAATAVGAVDIDGDVLMAAALALVWFVVGYAFYACLFACGGALVPRQEELQSVTTPLTLVLLISFFVSFAVQSNPDGTLAHVTSFIPFTAPICMPARIALGEAAVGEVIAALVITLGCAVALIPLAGRIYSGAVLRTGTAVKLRDAWQSAGAG